MQALELYKYTDKEEKKLLSSMTILVDTREHENKNNHILDFFDSKKIPWKKRKLDYGDYSFMIPLDESLGIFRDLYFDKHIMIERKSNLDEFACNLTKERDRIKKELTLAPLNKVIVIENGSYEDVVNGNYHSDYSPKSYFGTIHSLWHEFNVPIIFMPDKRYTGNFIVGYFWYYFRGFIK